MEYRWAVGRARLPSITDSGQGVDPTLEERVRGLHVDDLGRARPSEGAGAPNHQDGILVDAQVGIVYAVVVVLGAVEDYRPAFEHALVAGFAEVALAELLGDNARLD